VEAEFDPAIAVAVLSTPEIAINPLALAETMRECIAAHRRIEVRYNRTIVRAEECNGIRILTNGKDCPFQDSFDHVVNALWLMEAMKKPRSPASSLS
jgi:hypothetical protein